jgi:hypothetical protein
MKLNLPPLYEQADLFHLFPLLIESGIPFMESLDICKEEFPNYEPEFVEIKNTINSTEEEDRSLVSVDFDLYLQALEDKLSQDFINLSTNLSPYKRSFYPDFVAIFTIGYYQGDIENPLKELGKKILDRIPHKIPKDFQESGAIKFYRNLGENCSKYKRLIDALKEKNIAELKYPSEEVFNGLVSIVESGDSLSNAMFIYRQNFPRYQQRIVENSEKTKLEDFLLRKLSDYLKLRESLRQKYKNPS